MPVSRLTVTVNVRPGGTCTSTSSHAIPASLTISLALRIAFRASPSLSEAVMPRTLASSTLLRGTRCSPPYVGCHAVWRSHPIAVDIEAGLDALRGRRRWWWRRRCRPTLGAVTEHQVGPRVIAPNVLEYAQVVPADIVHGARAEVTALADLHAPVLLQRRHDRAVA